MKTPWKKEVLDLLQGFPRSPKELGIQRIQRVLQELGSPQHAFPSVLIAGTNGKGSVAAFVESSLRQAGYRTGRYTSPHLKELTERISLDGKNCTFRELYEHLLVVRRHADRESGLSYFEAITAAAFLLFRDAGVDMAVIEVGLGGRLDATNVTDPLISVITSISLDHQRLLGNTMEAIAREKAGITRPGTPVIFGTPRGLFDGFLERHLLGLGGIPEVLGREFRVIPCENGFTYQSDDMELKGLLPALPGAFQYENAALAVRVTEKLGQQGHVVSTDAIRRGLALTQWPARLQVIAARPVTVVDGAHNTGAARRLVETLRKTFKFKKLIMVHGSKPNKDYPGFLRVMAPVVDQVIETRAGGLEDPDLVLKAALAAGMKGRVVTDPVVAVKQAWRAAGPQDLVLICGSLYLAGEVLRWSDETGLDRSRTA